MNERIKELFKQTALHRNDHTTEQRLYEVEKFAELIIKETLMVARVGMELGPSMAEAVYNYFGVEE